MKLAMKASPISGGFNNMRPLILIIASLAMLVVVRIPVHDGVSSRRGGVSSRVVDYGAREDPGNSSARSLDRTSDLPPSGMQSSSSSSSSSSSGNGSNSRASSSSSSSSSSSAGTAAERRIIDNDPDLASVPIYLHDRSSAGGSSTSSPSSSVVIGYGSLASVWDRTTTYDDILHRARNDTFPSDDGLPSHRRDGGGLLRQLRGGGGDDDVNVTAIFHTSPKMASSTLRGACMDHQRESCGDRLQARPRGWRFPEGYRTPVRLTQLFGECPSTRHFCVMGKIPLIPSYAAHYGNRTFLHMFPFRTYDEWARSALHQASYRGGEAECRHTEALLDDCKPHRYELDLERYTKSTLATFVRSYVRLASVAGVDIVSDRHRILLYDYQYLDEIMASLSGLDDDDDGVGEGGEGAVVPRLPGTERRINSANATLESGKPRVQQGPCADEGRIMEKFHGCFSDKLGPLY
ncbi:hypothetical protein ACHAW5_001144 [Stephanodiscus triporus]|uniref:Membrane-associated protein n=1 Tax=Stephanodiscus triporus TaxID=2934178 RepID=A0ABD3QQL7_9STRA